MDALAHATIHLSRFYPFPPARVFHALSDPAARQRWSPPNPDQGFVYERTDFTVGGIDISRCGPKDNLFMTVEARYLDIVADTRIIFAETVSTAQGKLSIGLVSFELVSEDEGTLLKLTIQLASLVGEEMVEGNRNGWTAALRNISAELERD